MSEKYPFSAYDKYLTLKMSPGLWLIMVYLMMPYVVTIISVVKKRGDRMAIINMVYPDRSSLGISAVVSLVALGLIYAWARRSPVAPPHVRWIWHRGRIFLFSAILVNVLAIVAAFFNQDFYVVTYTIKLNLIVSALICVYLFTSPRVRDTFADYPHATQDELEEHEKELKKGKDS